MDFRLSDYPLVTFVVCFVVFVLTAFIGAKVRGRADFNEAQRDEVTIVLTSAMTLLAFIIGFTFQMAGGRYDLRKTDEAVEANSIGTEYLRVGLLDTADAKTLHDSLKQYLEVRIAWYETSEASPGYARIAQDQAALENTMWGIVERAAKEKQTPVRSMVASGMNETLDDAGYALSARINRIPRPAWWLMCSIALFCSFFIGYDVRSQLRWFRAMYVLPGLFAVSFCMIADLDTARGGLINIEPDNLIQLAAQLKSQ